MYVNKTNTQQNIQPKKLYWKSNNDLRSVVQTVSHIIIDIIRKWTLQCGSSPLVKTNTIKWMQALTIWKKVL